MRRTSSWTSRRSSENTIPSLPVSSEVSGTEGADTADGEAAAAPADGSDVNADGNADDNDVATAAAIDEDDVDDKNGDGGASNAQRAYAASNDSVHARRCESSMNELEGEGAVEVSPHAALSLPQTGAADVVAAAAAAASAAPPAYADNAKAVISWDDARLRAKDCMPRANQ